MSSSVDTGYTFEALAFMLDTLSDFTAITISLTRPTDK